MKRSVMQARERHFLDCTAKGISIWDTFVGLDEIDASTASSAEYAWSVKKSHLTKWAKELARVKV